MDYVEAYLVVCVNFNTKVDRIYKEAAINMEVYCPNCAFLKRTDAEDYAMGIKENTLIVPCAVPKVVE